MHPDMKTLSDRVANLEKVVAVSNDQVLRGHVAIKEEVLGLASLLKTLRRQENAHLQVRSDDAADSTALSIGSTGEKTVVHVRSKLGGYPASSLTCVDNGGATLLVSLNGEPYLPLAKGDSFTNERINTLQVKVSGTGAGTAILRLGAFTMGDE